MYPVTRAVPVAVGRGGAQPAFAQQPRPGWTSSSEVMSWCARAMAEETVAQIRIQSARGGLRRLQQFPGRRRDLGHRLAHAPAPWPAAPGGRQQGAGRGQLGIVVEGVDQACG